MVLVDNIDCTDTDESGWAERRDPCVSRAEAYIQLLLDQTPPLSAEEKRHLSRLLSAPDRGSA